MSSPLLALFHRSIREDTRSRYTYLSRAGLVGLILLFMWITQQSMSWEGAPGLRFFTQVIYINVVFVTLAGLSYFASAIAEEKEEMTLGLLRMTSLNPLSILLGKSTSRLFGALLLLLVQVPFTLLAVTLGGVSLHQIAAAYWTLGAYIFLLCNVALLFSVMCRRTGSAAALTGLCVVSFFFAPWVIGGFLRLLVTISPVVGSHPIIQALRAGFEWAGLASPFARLSDIATTGFSDPLIGFQVVSNLAAGVVFFLLAWAGFDFFTRDLSDAAPRRTAPRRGSRLRLFGAGRPWKNAVAWKEFHFTAFGRYGLLSKTLVLALIAALIAWTMRLSTRPAQFNWTIFGALMIWTGGLALLLDLGFAASRIFRQELKWKTLSSLAMLPMSMRRLAWQKVWGTLPSLIPSALVFLAGWVLLLLSMLKSSTGFNESISLVVVQAIGYGVVQAILFPHLVADLSLRLKRGALALGIAIMWVGNTIAGILAGLIFREAAFILLIVASLLLTAWLHVLIRQKLESLAAEES